MLPLCSNIAFTSHRVFSKRHRDVGRDPNRFENVFDPWLQPPYIGEFTYYKILSRDSYLTEPCVKLSNFAGILWLSGFVLNCALFVILCFRRRARTFPIFSVFIGFSIIRSLLLFWLWRLSQWDLYRTVYFGFMFIDTCLQFALVWEIASKVFRRRGEWVPDVRDKLVFWSIGSVAIASVLTALQQPAGHGWLQNAVLRADFFPSILISELFIAMLVLSSEAGLNWRTHVAGITVGLAAYSFPAVVISTMANLHGFDKQGYLSSALENSRKELYVACLIYWCYSMSRPEPESRVMPPHMDGQISELRTILVQRRKDWSEQ